MFTGTARFRPLAEIGRGSMGVVYRVHDAETDAEVALKTLEALDAEQLYHLKQEFRVLSGLFHPNLVELYELVVGSELGFFTMELVDGPDFLTHVRRRTADGVPTGDSALRCIMDATLQLVEGLAAIHAAGKLHRDIKPSNVLVTESGRIVILDFGLATALAPAELNRTDGIAGTLAYAAPDQMWGLAPHAAADWYSVGVLIYEAIVGRLPFEGAPARILQQKMKGPPLSLRTIHPNVPADLDALVAALLRPDPAQRPSEAELRARLTALAGTLRPSTSDPCTTPGDDTDRAPPRRPSMTRTAVAPAPSGDAPFVGRDEELAILRAAERASSAGETAIVRIVGPSGIGKTELVRRFLSDVECEPGAVILRGRCHPQEMVPYKAFDSVADNLSRLLLSLPADTAQALVPVHRAALCTLFPILGRVPAIADAGPPDQSAEPREIRRRGFQALRELLAALGGRRRTVLWIDDWQWGDLDSAALLRELVRTPGGPAMLVVLSHRSEGPQRSPVLAEIDDVAAATAGAWRSIELGPLPREQTRDLAERLGVSGDADVTQLVDEAEGSPFLLHQLARLGSASAPFGVPVSRRLQLAAVLADRVERLGGEARALLEIVSVAGRPVDRSLALSAAGLAERERPVALRLERDQLLRTTLAGEQPEVEIYHDRIRELVLYGLPAAQLSTRHRQLAIAIERTPDPDPQELFVHYLGAGEERVARRHGHVAADRAAAALAFDRAAQLYRQVLELPGEAGEIGAIRVKLAEALGNGGRSAEAAEAFDAAVSERPPGADDDETLDLKRRAADQYLRAGRLVEGTARTRAVLASVGVDFPATAGRALAYALVQRGRLAWRGRRFARRAEALPEAARLRLEAFWGATVTLGVVDQVLADAVGVRHFIEAFDLGDPVHAARALGLESAKAAQFGGRFSARRADSMLALMAELVRDGGGAYEEAYLEIARGVCAYQNARWREAHERCEAGNAILRARCIGVSWELATGEAFALTALAHLGELRELAVRLPAAIRGAEERGDLYASVGFRSGMLNLVWLAQDRPDEARRQADEAIARWPATGTFHVQHYLHLIASVHIDLYVGDPWRAWHRVAEAWPKARNALILAMQLPRVELRGLRARVALACAAAGASPDGAAPPASGWPTNRLLQLAERDAGRIARERDLGSAPAHAALIRAGVCKGRGQLGEAAALYGIAAVDFERSEMGLYAALARTAATALDPDSRGVKIEQTAYTWLSAQEVRNPNRLAASLLPAHEATP